MIGITGIPVLKILARIYIYRERDREWNLDETKTFTKLRKINEFIRKITGKVNKNWIDLNKNRKKKRMKKSDLISQKILK